MSFGERIKTISGRKSQAEFANKLGASRSALQVWEYDKGTPLGDVLLKLYKKFNVNINWLISGEGDPFVKDDQRSISLEEKVVIIERRITALKKTVDILTKN